jgi:hypothetical protein
MVSVGWLALAQCALAGLCWCNQYSLELFQSEPVRLFYKQIREAGINFRESFRNKICTNNIKKDNSRTTPSVNPPGTTSVVQSAGPTPQPLLPPPPSPPAIVSTGLPATFCRAFFFFFAFVFVVFPVPFAVIGRFSLS